MVRPRASRLSSQEYGYPTATAHGRVPGVVSYWARGHCPRQAITVTLSVLPFRGNRQKTMPVRVSTLRSRTKTVNRSVAHLLPEVSLPHQSG